MKKTALFLTLIMIFTFSFASAEEWICPNCGKTNTRKFCTSCGTKHDTWICPNCGAVNEDAYCGDCGAARPVDLSALYGIWIHGPAENEEYLIFLENGTMYIILQGKINESHYIATKDTISLIDDSGNEFSPFSYTADKDQLHFEGDTDTYTRSDMDVETLLKKYSQPDGTVFSGTLTGFSWTININIEKYTEIEESGWSLPDGAKQTDAKEEIHHYDQVLDHYEDEEVSKTRQVYDHDEYSYVDNGDGTFSQIANPVYRTESYFETEQKPVYVQVPRYQTKYYYTIWRWIPFRDATAAGNDHDIYQPAFTLEEGEREGQHNELYCFTLTYDQDTENFTTDYLCWQKLQAGENYHIITTENADEYYIADAAGQKLGIAIQDK